VTTPTLTVNAGSTSVKVSWFDDDCGDGRPMSLDEALTGPVPAAVVHRIVHGGARTAPEILDDAAVAQLRTLTELAPLHQPPALDAVDRCRAQWPAAVHVGCFDTAFHASMPAAATTYALPARWRDRVRVYGFHGLAHAWAARRVGSAAPEVRRTLVAHLGGGASLCAVHDGRSVATTMGFTPMDGLVMATRSGTIDPGALLWMAAHSEENLEHVLDRESGLLGLCGSADVRDIEPAWHAGDPHARLAVDVWTHRFLRQAGGMIAVLGGLDALVFSGGVGEHSALLRSSVVDALGWLGVSCVDEAAAHAEHDLTELTAPGAAVRTFVVHTREDLQMLTEARSLLERVS
jgi:acetate kinase